MCEETPIEDKNASDCELGSRLYECKQCDWISDNERAAVIHRRFHNISVRYTGMYDNYKSQEPIGKCFKCGKLFWNRADWVYHELDSYNKTHHPDKNWYCNGAKHANLELLEWKQYIQEPVYVRRFQNSPGSPVGLGYNITEDNRIKRKFKQERIKLRQKEDYL